MYNKEEKLPEWVPIYFMTITDTKYKCNICDIEVDVGVRCLELLHHVQEVHKEVYELHKESNDTVGYQIEFLQFNMKDDEDLKNDAVILGEICEAPSELKENVKSELNQTNFVILPNEKSDETPHSEHSRKRSWVWKYFEQLTKTIYRCTLCNVVLSIKGSNSNNMNRHVRTRHAAIFSSEISRKGVDDDSDMKWGEPVKSDTVEKVGSGFRSKKPRRSWVWSYFSLVSRTRARCKICKRVISHGGNATGNMNRHLKIVHNKRGDGSHWAWKVFDVGDTTYSCKICQYQFIKYDDLDKSIKTILEHLKEQHNVISGSQIITSATYELDND